MEWVQIIIKFFSGKASWVGGGLAAIVAFLGLKSYQKSNEAIEESDARKGVHEDLQEDIKETIEEIEVEQKEIVLEIEEKESKEKETRINIEEVIKEARKKIKVVGELDTISDIDDMIYKSFR